jgi:hypothetical protein
MSITASITKTIVTLAPNAGDSVDMEPKELAQRVGADRQKVNQVVFALAQKGVISTKRGSNGRSIVGLTMVDPVTARRLAKGTSRGSRARKEVVEEAVAKTRTPHLDGYLRQKEHFVRLVKGLGDRIEATFREDPIAEEGLRLRARLEALEPQFSDLLKRASQEARDLRYLRERFKVEIADSVAAGVVVTESTVN